HYKSKKDIFHAVLDEMARRYEQQTVSMRINGLEASADIDRFAAISEEQLIEIGRGLFLYFLQDEYTRKFRKMLTVEQYRNKELAALFTKQYTDDPLEYQSKLFGLLTQTGVCKPEDSNIMAIHFYAPIYLLLTLCDRQPEREREALKILEQHMKQFSRLYRIGGDFA
ncbi:MAG TPA: TetR/AcrR family transcriptional regulator, partial [Pseudoflavonifractor sp.]|nr:TetR/AcrR family transcriptional regulator [Pseudoflavonifractor sp.]